MPDPLKHALGDGPLLAPPRPDHSPTLPPALPRTKPAAAPSTLRTDGLTLVQASFNLTMGCLNVRERNQVAECSAKSAIDMTSLYGSARRLGSTYPHTQQGTSKRWPGW